MKLISVFKTPIIEFLCDEHLLGNIPEPVGAFKEIAPWFGDIPRKVLSGQRDNIGAVSLSAKACKPMMDAMSLGFIIPLWADLNVRTDADGKFIEFSRSNTVGPIAEFHDPSQLEGIGKMSPTKGAPALKFINPWVIKTAPGYSVLFTAPVNHFDERFTCLSAVVDNDEYPKQTNFPAVWHKRGHDAIVKAGTPLVTCIPFKRSDMVRESKPRAITPKEAKHIRDLQIRQETRRGVYTDELREPRK